MLLLGQCDVEITDKEKEDPKLQRAIEEMRQLDEILSAKICKEKQVRRQRKKLQTKLWQELLVDTELYSLYITSLLHHNYSYLFILPVW